MNTKNKPVVAKEEGVGGRAKWVEGDGRFGLPVRGAIWEERHSPGNAVHGRGLVLGGDRL